MFACGPQGLRPRLALKLAAATMQQTEKLVDEDLAAMDAYAEQKRDFNNRQATSFIK